MSEPAAALAVAYGMGIRSDVDLGVQCAHAAPEVVIERLSDPVPDAAVDWFDDDRTGVSGGTLGPDFVLSFEIGAHFVVSDDGHRILWWAPDLDDPTLRHLLIDHVLPRALHRQGSLVLHAAAVALDGSAVALVGESGRGKSTIALTLSMAGLALVCDDALRVLPGPAGEEPRVVRSYPGVRVHPDNAALPHGGAAGTLVRAGSAKRRVEVPEPSAAETAPGGDITLRHVLVLTDPEPGEEAAACSPLRPAMATVTLLEHSFRLGRPSELGDTVERVAELVRSVPVSTVAYGHRPSDLGDLERRVRRLLA